MCITNTVSISDSSEYTSTFLGASAEGADMTTFLAPPFKWALAFSVVVKTPVDCFLMRRALLVACQGIIPQQRNRLLYLSTELQLDPSLCRI